MGMNVESSMPEVVLLEIAPGVYHWDCPHCGQTHEIIGCVPFVTGCKSVIGNVRITGVLPLQPQI